MQDAGAGIARLRRRAERHLARGDWAAAVIGLRALLAQSPRDADGWFNLGFALRRAGAFEESLDAYAEALRQGVADQAMVHVNRAAILADHLRRDDDAEAELRRALQLSPGHPAALLNLGNLHEERGRREHAVEAYEALLARGEGDAAAAEALARLAQLKPAVAADDPMLGRLRRSAGSTALPPATRANLWLARGRALDALRLSADAIDALVRGKALAHAGHPAYDAAAAEARVQQVLDAFPLPAPGVAGAGGSGEPGAAAPVAEPGPLWICGMFRSGSTLLEQVLAAHPDVVAGGELDLLPRMAAGVLAPFPATMATLDGQRLQALAQAYHRAVLARLRPAPGARVFTDKRPDNLLLVGLAKRLFPRAKVVVTRRDPRDIALSILMQHLNPRAFPWAATLSGIGHHFLLQRRLALHWQALYPGDVLDFDYDAFVATPDAPLRTLLDALGLPWHPGCLQFDALGNTVKTASAWQVRRPLYGDASGRWRRYRGQLAPLEDMLRAAGVDLPPDPDQVPADAR